MKTLYFISNNLLCTNNIIYPDSSLSLDIRMKTILSCKGEETAKNISNLDIFDSLDVVYSSFYVGAMSTGKYLTYGKNIDMIIDERLGERLIGDLNGDEYRFLKGMQEHDFSYKLNGGEALIDVMERMKSCVKDILKSNYQNVAIVTHNIALLSLFIDWCNKGYNLEDRLILDYHEDTIFDGSFHDIDIIEVNFLDNRLDSIRRLK